MRPTIFRVIRVSRVPLLVVAGLLGACLGSTPLDPSTGLDVRVRRGPIKPVQVDSVDNTAPVSNAGVVVFSSLGTPLGQAFTDTTGDAKIPASPGIYQVGVSSCPGAQSIPDPVSAEVLPGTFTVVSILCDTGIR